MLRCKQIGFTVEDLEALTVGAVLDVFAEHADDDLEWTPLATQDDINRFFG